MKVHQCPLISQLHWAVCSWCLRCKSQGPGTPRSSPEEQRLHSKWWTLRRLPIRTATQICHEWSLRYIHTSLGCLGCLWAVNSKTSIRQTSLMQNNKNSITPVPTERSRRSEESQRKLRSFQREKPPAWVLLDDGSVKELRWLWCIRILIILGETVSKWNNNSHQQWSKLVSKSVLWRHQNTKRFRYTNQEKKKCLHPAW